MKVYTIRNEKGEYLSMSMDLTKNWFEASKFPESEVEQRKLYLNDGFKIVEFELVETQ